MQMRRIVMDRLRRGDIVLTTSSDPTSVLIRERSGGEVSHALICAGAGSLIDSTSDNVHAHNVQREMYGPDDVVHVLRLREPIDDLALDAVIESVRFKVGTRYSAREAMRAMGGSEGVGGRREYCSRLVARAFAAVGVFLVADPDHCTPQQLLDSKMLERLFGMMEVVSAAELKAWEERPSQVLLMQETIDDVLDRVRLFDNAIEALSEIDDLVLARPEIDADVALIFRETGYLNLWRRDLEVNPWHYDLERLEDATNEETISEMRSVRARHLQDTFSAGLRFAQGYFKYGSLAISSGLETFRQLAVLYRQLVYNDEVRRNVFINWLDRHFPGDVAKHLECIVPHSERWFAMVDTVNPIVSAQARAIIALAGSTSVCFICGDEGEEYRVANGAKRLPGVFSLQLCSDCLGQQQSSGLKLLLQPIRPAVA